MITIGSIPRSQQHDVTQVNHSRNNDTTPFAVTDEQTKTGEVTKPAESQIPSYEKPSLRNTTLKGFISAHKTDITTSLESQTDKNEKRDDLTKICPIHNKPHPLAIAEDSEQSPLRNAFLKAAHILTH